MSTLESIQDVIDALGGPSALADMLDVTQQAVSMWKVRGEIPAGWHYRLHVEALRRGHQIDPAVFGLFDPLVKAAVTREVAAVA